MLKRPPPLTKEQRAKLAEIEPALRSCVRKADFEKAKRLVAEIQPVLRSTGHTTRLLQAKNWLYECALEACELDFATFGFEGNRKLAGNGTRTYLEATAFLAICYLRQGNLEKAKFHVREAIHCVNNIRESDLYKAWSKNLAFLYDGKVLVGALAAAFKSWKITAFGFITAMTAYIIKVGAAVFCEAFAPDWLMIHVTEKN